MSEPRENPHPWETPLWHAWEDGFAAGRLDATRAAAQERGLDVRECECVPGHRCDCHDLRSLLHRILTSAEYGKMEAEGLAAAALGLRWSEADDRYVSAAALIEKRSGAES